VSGTTRGTVIADDGVPVESSAVTRPQTRRCRVLAAGIWGSAPGWAPAIKDLDEPIYH
jgi:hypothetical protein